MSQFHYFSALHYASLFFISTVEEEEEGRQGGGRGGEKKEDGVMYICIGENVIRVEREEERRNKREHKQQQTLGFLRRLFDITTLH